MRVRLAPRAERIVISRVRRLPAPAAGSPDSRTRLVAEIRPRPAEPIERSEVWRQRPTALAGSILTAIPVSFAGYNSASRLHTAARSDFAPSRETPFLSRAITENSKLPRSGSGAVTKGMNASASLSHGSPAGSTPATRYGLTVRIEASCPESRSTRRIGLSRSRCPSRTAWLSSSGLIFVREKKTPQ